MKRSASENIWLVIKYVLLIGFTILCVYPLVWLFLASFKTNAELYTNTWGLPEQWSMTNYVNAVVKGGVFRYFGNSVIIAVSVVLVTVILATMASYAIARMHWKLANLTHSIFLLGMMIPIYALVIPLFSIFKGMGLLDTHLAVIIPQIAVGFPLAIFIICGFMRSIPTELEEAAIIDGCTVFQCFFKIILPIAKSSVVTVAVVQFINVWNDLLLPRIFLTDSSKMTLPVGLTNFQAIGYMVIECKNSYFSEKLRSVPSTYKNRFYLLNNEMDIIVSSEENMQGISFPLKTRDFKRVKIVRDPSTEKNSYFTYQYMNNGWLLVSTINVGQLWKNIGIALLSVLLTFGIVLLVSLVIMRHAARVMVKPTKKLVDSMTAYQEGNFDSRFEVENQDEINQIGMVYNQMADKVQNLIEKNYTLEIANREAEIEFLKMQINPHFLYNCLDTISWLGFSNGNSEITDLAVALGKFLRASIKREDYYTVKQEMEVVDNYLFIQKYRFGDKIEIRHNIPDEVLNFYIPSFIIQPVIENSIVHGLEEQIEKGILWINIQLCNNKYLQFNLTDNGKGMDEEQLKQVIQNYSDKNKKSSIGLSNVYRRLNLLYGEACEFHVTSVAGEGTEVTFRIPVMQVPGNHTLNET